MKDQYACVVIGDGPLGNAMALRVAAAGFETLLVGHECEQPVSRPVPPAGLERLPIKQVERVTNDSGVVISVGSQPADRLARKISAKMIVEAAKHPGSLGNPDGDQQRHETNQAAIWGHYRNARREAAERCESSLLLPTSQKNSCFWFVPLPNDLTSIGVVGKCAYLLNGRGQAAQVFEDELVQCPTLADRLMNATLVGELHSVPSFARGFMPYLGDGWLVLPDLVEDASSCSAEACFAQCLGESAADAIIAGLRAGDLSVRQLGQWLESAGLAAPGFRHADNPATPPNSAATSTR